MKFNEATKNRPAGDRILDAPQLYVDIEKHVEILKEEEAWQKNDRNAMTVFKSDNVSIVLVALHGGATMLPQEIGLLVTAQVLEGSISFESSQGIKNLKENNIVVLHSNEPFNATAIEDTILLLTLFTE